MQTVEIVALDPCLHDSLRLGRMAIDVRHEFAQRSIA
jgi:hypothetical protein